MDSYQATSGGLERENKVSFLYFCLLKDGGGLMANNCNTGLAG